MRRLVGVFAGAIAYRVFSSGLAGCMKPTSSLSEIQPVREIELPSTSSFYRVPSSQASSSSSESGLLDGHKRRNADQTEQDFFVAHSPVKGKDRYDQRPQSRSNHLAQLEDWCLNSNHPREVWGLLRTALEDIESLSDANGVVAGSIQDDASFLTNMVTRLGQSLEPFRPSPAHATLYHQIYDVAFKDLGRLAGSLRYQAQVIIHQVFSDETLLVCLAHYVSGFISATFVPYRRLESLVFEAVADVGLFLPAPGDQEKRRLMFQVLARLFGTDLVTFGYDYQYQELIPDSERLLKEVENNDSEYVLEVARSLSHAFDESSKGGPLFMPQVSGSMFAYHMLSYILTYSAKRVRARIDMAVLTPTLRDQLKFRQLLLEVLFLRERLVAESGELQTSLIHSRQVELRHSSLLYQHKNPDWDIILESSIKLELEILGFLSYGDYYSFFARHLEQWRSPSRSTPLVWYSSKVGELWSKYRQHIQKAYLEKPLYQPRKGMKQVWSATWNKVLRGHFFRDFLKSKTSSQSAAHSSWGLRRMIGMRQPDDGQNAQRWAEFLDLMDWRFASTQPTTSGSEEELSVFWSGLLLVPKLAPTFQSHREYTLQLDQLFHVGENMVTADQETKGPLGGYTNGALLKALVTKAKVLKRFMPPQEATSSHTNPLEDGKKDNSFFSSFMS